MLYWQWNYFFSLSFLLSTFPAWWMPLPDVHLNLSNIQSLLFKNINKKQRQQHEFDLIDRCETSFKSFLIDCVASCYLTYVLLSTWKEVPFTKCINLITMISSNTWHSIRLCWSRHMLYLDTWLLKIAGLNTKMF